MTARRPRLALCLLVIVLVTLASCTGAPGAASSVPTSAPTSTAPPETTTTPAATISTTPATSATTPAPTPTLIPTPRLAPLDAFKKGIHFNDWAPFSLPTPPPSSGSPTARPPLPGRGLYAYPETDESLRKLAATGATWISITVVFGQETVASTTLFRDSPATATDAEIVRVVRLAHSLGMRVMLFPSLILSNDQGHWWGQIGTAFTTDSQWQQWFASYGETINHYATLADEAEVDMFSIGRELGGVTHRADDWRRVVQDVRELFSGPITYSALSTAPWGFPHGEENRIQWWDAIDYIGVSAYYGLTNKNDPTVAELKAAWVDKGHIALLEGLHTRFNRPVIITEIGYPSYDGANQLPAGDQKGAPIDLQEQADCYRATLEVMLERPWVEGIFWWQWWVKQVGGPNDATMTPYGKPAAEVLKGFYAGQ